MDDDNLPSPATEKSKKLISSFMENTSSSREEAKSFLETHQWDLDAAVSAFTENNVAEVAAAAAESNVINPSDTQLLPTVAARTRKPFSSKRTADTPCESERNKRRELAGNKPTLAVISGGTTDSDSDEYEGGEQGGTTIMQEPEEGEDVGEEDKESDEERPVRSSSRTTFRIVSTEPKVVITFIVTIWRNGFTIDDGPLNTMDDPEDAAFIEYVQSLEPPRDLNPKDNQIRHRIKLIRRQEEDFNESPRLTPFQGVGRTLADSDSAATEPPASSESLTTTPLPSMSQVVNPAAPTTSIHDTATILPSDSETTIMQEPEEGEDVDDKDEESDVERPVQSSPRTTFRIVSAEPEKVLTFIVTIWRNGFTVDDEPLNTLDDPDDAAFIEFVQRLKSPRDLNPEDNQVRYRIKLIMRKEEDFNESPKPTPFQGVGRTISGSESAATEPPASSDSLTITTPPSMSVVVDPAAPITSIQLRLADGTRIFTQFNTHHTVRDVRGFIDASRPSGSNDYQLLINGIPPKPLLDFDQTIEKAGISNSVLIQKY